VKEVTLQGGESEIVEFEFVPEAERTYDVDIEGMIGTIFVVIPIPVPPLPPYLSNLTVTPTEIEIGDNVTISLDIRDMHNQSFTYIVTMQIDELTLLVDVELEPYEFKTVSRTITPEMIGEYHVWVQGLTGNFTVKAPPKPAEFKVSNLEVDSDRVAKGDVVTITVEVENIGEKEGTHTVLFEVDGLVTEMVEVNLDGGESTTVTFTITETAGDHTVGVEDLTGDFTVTAPISPGYVAVILIVIIAAVAILYAKWKGILPTLYPEVDDEIDSHEKRTNRRNKN